MDFATRWLPVALSIFIVSVSALAQTPAKANASNPPRKEVPVEEGKIDMNQVREELGVNEFTAPSIEHLLAELMDMRPLPIDKLWMDLKPEAPQDRSVLAL